MQAGLAGEILECVYRGHVKRKYHARGPLSNTLPRDGHLLVVVWRRMLHPNPLRHALHLPPPSKHASLSPDRIRNLRLEIEYYISVGQGPHATRKTKCAYQFGENGFCWALAAVWAQSILISLLELQLASIEPTPRISSIHRKRRAETVMSSSKPERRPHQAIG